MKRNLSVLQFQRRLIRCALKSPTAEAYRLLGIVSSNLREFVEVRIPLDPDFEIVADEMIEVYYELDRAIAKVIPEVYECNSAGHYEHVIAYLRDIISGYLKEQSLEDTMRNKVNALTAFFAQASHDTIFYEVPDYHGVIEYIHYALMPYLVHEALDLDASADAEFISDNLDMVLYEIFSRRFTKDAVSYDEFEWEIEASRTKISPPSPKLANTVTAISNIIQWATEDTRDHDVQFSISLFPDNLAGGAQIYSPNIRSQTYPSGRVIKFINMEVSNPMLIEFDRGVQMLLDHMVEGDIEMGKYDDDGPEISGVRGVKITRPSDPNVYKNSDTFLRGPFSDSSTIRHIMTNALMMDQVLVNQICSCTTLSEVEKLAKTDVYMRNRWQTILSMQDLSIRSVYMTIYRTGEIHRNANNDICFGDSNVALMLFLACILRHRAVFFLELRARGNTLANLQLMELLRNRGAKVYVVPKSQDYFKCKVHAKVLMARFWDSSDTRTYNVTAVSTGNWEEGAQRGFSDSILVRRGVSEAECAEFKRFWSTLGVAGLNTSHVDEPCDTLFWEPGSIKEALLNQINYCRRAVQVNYNEDLWKGLRRPFYGPHSRIRIKCNHLTDPDIINALLLAVYAGVDVSIIVRTTCTMPLNTGEDNLEIRSIAGKYLEHDRFYLFETETIDGGIERTGFISSADLMPRNLENRIEIMQMIPDELFESVRDIFDTLFDTASQPNRGFYNFQLTTVHPTDSHYRFGDRKALESCNAVTDEEEYVSARVGVPPYLTTPKHRLMWVNDDEEASANEVPASEDTAQPDNSDDNQG